MVWALDYVFFYKEVLFAEGRCNTSWMRIGSTGLPLALLEIPSAAEHDAVSVLLLTRCP
jgi:hypothetical protein